MNTDTENQVDSDIALQKLADATIPGFIVEVDPDEAELLGAFMEDALSEDDAMDGSIELLDDEPDDNSISQWLAWGLS